MALRCSEHRLGDLEIAGEQPAVALVETLGHAAADELLHIGRVAAQHPREAGEIFAPLVAQALQHHSGVDRHRLGHTHR